MRILDCRDSDAHHLQDQHPSDDDLMPLHHQPDVDLSDFHQPAECIDGANGVSGKPELLIFCYMFLLLLNRWRITLICIAFANVFTFIMQGELENVSTQNIFISVILKPFC